MLRHYVSPTQQDWDTHLPTVEFAINNAYQESVKATPFVLNYGQHPHTPAGVSTEAPPAAFRVAASATAKSKRRFSQTVLLDTTPMPENIPSVPEIGVTSAPLQSASYFIGARCLPYNDDFMKCKVEAYGKGEKECLKEGRKVTRCAASV